VKFGLSHSAGNIRLRVFEKRVPRKIFGPKRDEVTWEWIRLHNEEFYDLNSSQNIIRVSKSGRMRWLGHVAPMGERRDTYRGLVKKNLRERDHLGDMGVDQEIILK
jgi:hypothetical protein